MHLKYSLSISCFIYFFIIQAQSITNLPNPYNTLQSLLPPDMHGWFGTENKQYLKQFIETKKCKTIIEIGTWLGASAIFMASLIQKNQGILYAVDHWKGQYYWQNPSKEITSRMPTLYDQFLSNVIHHNLTDTIIPIKMASLEAASMLDIVADLIYIDASHKEQDVFNDIMQWHTRLNPHHGIMCGDDWQAKEVQKGVTRAAALLHKKIHHAGGFWYFN